MKALTLTQPWATLVAIGMKKIETRSWSTSYRGPLAIHAAKGFPRWASQFALHELARGCAIPTPLPFGVIVATALLVDVVRTEAVVDGLSQMEFGYGDYRAGRFAWLLENVRELPEPVPVRGALGLWDIPDGISIPY